MVWKVGVPLSKTVCRDLRWSFLRGYDSTLQCSETGHKKTFCLRSFQTPNTDLRAERLLGFLKGGRCLCPCWPSVRGLASSLGNGWACECWKFCCKWPALWYVPLKSELGSTWYPPMGAWLTRSMLPVVVIGGVCSQTGSGEWGWGVANTPSGDEYWSLPNWRTGWWHSSYMPVPKSTYGLVLSLRVFSDNSYTGCF